MTVILDPGNQAESRVDGLVRAWRTTAGLWKTDYNAGIPPTSPIEATSAITGNLAGGNIGFQTYSTRTATRSGYWAIGCSFTVGPSNAAGNDVKYRFVVNGTPQATQTTQNNTAANNQIGHAQAPVFLSNGQSVAFQIDYGAGSLTPAVGGTLYLWFVPTIANPQ